MVLKRTELLVLSPATHCRFAWHGVKVMILNRPSMLCNGDRPIMVWFMSLYLYR